MTIMTNARLRNSIFLCALVCLIAVSGALCIAAQGKEPIILIPGLTGSELINGKTGEKVWFKPRRSKYDDLSLPISPNLAANRDSLIPGDIIRTVKAPLLPRADIYGGLIEFLVRQGYREAKWDVPSVRGYENTVYVFPYDWRRDNVENSQLLIRKIEALKRRLRRPNLKFNIIGHSMGGLIARYAAMYGGGELPAGAAVPVPTWAGAKSIDKIILLGTPNEGSVLSLRNLINGVAIVGGDINLPFIQNLSKFDVFTIPSAFQLLPSPGAIKAFDEGLQPIEIDIYDPATWTQYGWNAIDDKDFAKHFTPAEQRDAKAYFAIALDRGKRLHQALDAKSAAASPVAISVIGAECKDTLDGTVVYRKKDGVWVTLFKADSFATVGGRKVTSEELKKVLYAPGDGVVTRRSLLAETLSRLAGLDSLLLPVSTTFLCEGHDKLPADVSVQTRIIAILSGGK